MDDDPLRPMPMTPEEIDDLVRRTRAEMDTVRWLLPAHLRRVRGKDGRWRIKP